MIRKCPLLNNRFRLKRVNFFNSGCEKAADESPETEDQQAPELFAPKLIHESRNRSIAHSLPGFFPHRNISRGALCRAANS